MSSIGLALAYLALFVFYACQVVAGIVILGLHCVFYPLGLLTDKWIKKR